MKTNFITKALGKLGGKAKKFSPEIMLGLGVTAIIAGTVCACKATRKLDDTMAEADARIAKIKDSEEAAVTEAEHKEVKRELAKEYARLGLNLALLYAPSALLLTGGIVGVLSSHKELKSRNTALTAAYTSLGNAFAAYREKITESIGPEAEEKIRLGLEEGDLERVEEHEDGSVSTTHEAGYFANGPVCDHVTVYFDEQTSAVWERSKVYQENFVKGVEDASNLIFNRCGYLQLSEVYKSLGMELSSESAALGWVRGHGDDHVSFNPRWVVVSTHDKFGDPIMEEKLMLTFNVNREPVWKNL